MLILLVVNAVPDAAPWRQPPQIVRVKFARRLPFLMWPRGWRPFKRVSDNSARFRLPPNVARGGTLLRV